MLSHPHSLVITGNEIYSTIYNRGGWGMCTSYVVVLERAC